MDSDVLFLLAILAFYVLQQVAVRRRKQGQPIPSPIPESEDGEADMELDDALAEIRRALGFGGSQMPTPDEPAYSAGTADLDRPSPSRAVERAKAPEARSDEFHRPETGRPDFEDEFERRPPRRGMPDVLRTRFPQTQPRKTTYDDILAQKQAKSALSSDDVFGFHDALAGHSHVLDSADMESTEPSHPVVQRLKSPEALMEAFVLREIVGPPKSRRNRAR